MKYMCHMFLALFAASTSFAATIDLSTLDKNFEALDGDVLTGTLDGESQHFKITIAKGAKITLRNATINGYNCEVESGDDCYDWAGLTCLGNCTIVLEGSNTVTGFNSGYPGIQAAKNEGKGEEYTLTIEGKGSLVASGNGDGAGIGSGYKGSCGNIIIDGGEIKATGGANAAGIGGGSLGTCGNIIINGGKVIATAGYDAAGIGSGNKGTCGNITISGGTVTATGGSMAAGIGSGHDGTNETITISGGKVTATGGQYGAGIGSGFGETDGLGTSGNITISGGEVTATASYEATGIGSGFHGRSGSITISGGIVKATGMTNSAGIGRGSEGTSGNITITNDVAKVVATKGRKATYSIVAGNGANAGSVTIGDKVGPVEESPFKFPASINLSKLPGDYEVEDGEVLTGKLDGEKQHYKITIADGAKITLSDATINGYDDLDYRWAGLTCLGNCTIVLSGANTVKGFCKYYPGIQAAKNEGDGEEYTLTIEGDGSLDASSNGYGAGIGGGYAGVCGNIAISGGKVTATGGGNAAGIGGGDRGTCGNITISGGTVMATGDAAGIGGGHAGVCGNITISGGKVSATGGISATGGSSAAGIGGGVLGKNGDITISGGEVVAAAGGAFGAGIGSGYKGTSGDITITKDVTKVVVVKGGGNPDCVGAGSDGTAGEVSIGGVVMEKPIKKELFIFPAPATLVDIEVVGSKTYAVIDGDYSGDDALNITEDKSVDRVVFERMFPDINGENNYSTIMFPFDISVKEVGSVRRILSFLGIGVDEENRKYVAVERIWCRDESEKDCNHDDVKLEAYKPYLIRPLLEGSISIKNTAPLVIKAPPTAENAFDVAQSSDYNQYGDYVFRGVVQTKTWGAKDPDVLGTDGAAAYGFAGTATEDVEVGQFAKVGEGAYIRPFRGYIYKKPVPKKVKSNGGDLLRQTASIDDLPDVMNIVVVDRKKDGSEQTTVIGQFYSRTGEIRMNRTERTYDLKGRSVRDASRMAKGVYLKK